MPAHPATPNAADSDSDAGNIDVAPELIEAAVRAAERLGRDVADIAIGAIAAEAGVSRSTLIRRLGGSRTVLDAAVRAAGIDPGGQPPVRVRAIDAAAALIGEAGLGAATLEAIAARADCSVFSLHAVFGGRDELMRAVFDQYSPIADIEAYLAQSHGNLHDTVHGFYRTVTHALDRHPRVAPAMFAEAFSRPASPSVQSLASHAAPRTFGALGAWFDAEIRAGNLRDQPVVLLAQQLLGPILIHMFLRPVAQRAPTPAFPDIDTVCDVFTDNFIRAVTTPQTPPPNASRTCVEYPEARSLKHYQR